MTIDKARKLFEERFTRPFGVFFDIKCYKTAFVGQEHLNTATIYNKMFEGFLAGLEINDPWDNLPKGKISIGEEGPRKLTVEKVPASCGGDALTTWSIETYADEAGGFVEVAAGYNCDPFRNGETMMWNVEKGVWE